MELTHQQNKSSKFIKSYENNTLFIGDKKYACNIILSEEKINKWNIQNIEKIKITDIGLILLYNPEIIIIGTGQKQYAPSNNFINHIHKKKIGVEFMITESACKTFNILLSEGRKVIAGLII